MQLTNLPFEHLGNRVLVVFHQNYRSAFSIIVPKLTRLPSFKALKTPFPSQKKEKKSTPIIISPSSFVNLAFLVASISHERSGVASDAQKRYRKNASLKPSRPSYFLFLDKFRVEAFNLRAACLRLNSSIQGCIVSSAKSYGVWP